MGMDQIKGAMGMMNAMGGGKGPMGDIDIEQLPIIPYPMVATCLGLRTEEPEIEFFDGYIRLMYDFNVEKAISGCLFEDLQLFNEEAARPNRRRGGSPKKPLNRK
jgi:hypothetical protein